MKVLMHMCCAPCSVYPLEVLTGEGFDVEGLFHNPNIHPLEEFKKRRDNVRILSGITGLKVNYLEDFSQDIWESFDGAAEERCRMCYSARLDKAAAYAAEKGFDAFTTSLLVSPYQKHELIKDLGLHYAQKYNVDFLYRDFRPGFRRGQQKAREMGLYRQKFCGCIISYREAAKRL